VIDSDPLERLSSAYRIEVDPETRSRHIDAVHAVIASMPPATVARSRFILRRFVAASAAALAIAAPVGMAVAAETAVPGDVLYPVKGVIERVRSVVDPKVEATHRVDEAERLIIRRAPQSEIGRAVRRAEVATSQLKEPGTLGPRLELIREQAEAGVVQQRVEDDHGSGTPHERPITGATEGSTSGSQHGSGTGGNKEGGTKSPDSFAPTTQASGTGHSAQPGGEQTGGGDGSRSGGSGDGDATGSKGTDGRGTTDGSVRDGGTTHTTTGTTVGMAGGKAP